MKRERREGTHSGVAQRSEVHRSDLLSTASKQGHETVFGLGLYALGLPQDICSSIWSLVVQNTLS